MRINNNALTESMYQFCQRGQTSSQPTSFGDLLRAATNSIQNAAATGSIQNTTGGGYAVVEGKLSPQLQLWHDYKEWKSQQPERVLPDSQGATEENLAYLLENFSGELSLFQCMEVVDTMREMGILTKEQMYAAWGMPCELVTMEPSCTVVIGPLESGRGMEWPVFEPPLANAQYLDDLLEILDRLLRGDDAEDIADDLQEAFDNVKQKVQEACILNS